ncbi:complex I NDUFA9 subunit family protein [Haloplanus rallus]|jgi:NADH dehydrogenase|uniref:Complex I NDUFA9 subunit family protein n=1 Tax=Haloplanus rallus TaxID=1816183 RepID=A0A6B9FGD1_9EURY|nr:complex I NDUFA9 subunit family protein [Haloplanus rallus]QGX96079.1 complex I NDUFA9 subunit family protein [Haloplanus rallus]
MKILVTGGTGFVGRHLCRELKSRGHSVTALARRPSEGELPGGVEKAMGDVTAYDSLVEPMEGMDAVVNLVALSPLFKPSGGDEMHDRVHRQGTENVVRAAEETGVEKILQMSALGADPNGATAYIRAKGAAEEIVKSSSLRYVIFRPSVIFGDGGEFVPFTKKLAPPYFTPLPGGGKTRFQPVWIGDLAPILADGLEDEAYDGGIYEIGGPERLTLAEVARTVHGSEGRSATVIPVPMGLAKIGLSVLGSLPGAPMGADQYRSLQFDNTTDHNDVEAFDVSESGLRTLGDYLADR